MSRACATLILALLLVTTLMADSNSAANSPTANPELLNNPDSNHQDHQSEYIVKRGDNLSIIVMGHPEFTLNDVLVLPDGTIHYPGLGSIQVAGMATMDIKALLERSLLRYIVSPIVTIQIRRLQDQRINILGHVNNPGQYQVFDSIDLFHALSLAGGVQDYRLVNKILIIRADSGVEEVKAKHYFRKSVAKRPIPQIHAGDTILVNSPWTKGIDWALLSFLMALGTFTMSMIRFMQ